MLMSEATNIGTIFRFKVGLSQYHKLSKQSAIAAFRNFDLKDKRKINSGLSGTDNKQYTEKEAESSPDVCELTRTSLSNSLESLLDKRLLRLIQLRRKFSLGWAAAEELLWASEAAQDDPVNVLHRKKKVLDAINKEEKRLSVSHDLPPDHIASKSADINIVETAFAFMLRRLAVRALIMKLHNEYEALKPYVCKSNLCIFQYYSLNFGPSLEISAMKEYLSENPRATLQQMNPKVLPAAWSLLKWCIASCTSHIQELKNSEDFLGNISGQFRQFRFMSGAPDKEAKFKKALETELKSNPSAQNYPTIFAFHGSPVKNWHSIIRHGLWYKHVANGRSHGNGVYFAMDGNISIAGYAAPTPSRWRSSTLVPSKCFVLAEIVNAPSKFVSTTPYYVVDKVDWIMCRYLLVMSAADDSKEYSVNTTYPPGGVLEQHLEFRACMGSAQVNIPRPSYYLEKILEACHRARLEAQYDRDDGCVFQMPNGVCEAANSVSFVTSSKITAAKWSSDHDWVAKNVENLLPPPEESSIGATIALHKELKGMIQDQQKALKEGGIERLGWHIPLEFNQDNLYQWTVEMHSFDPELPLAKDMKERCVYNFLVSTCSANHCSCSEGPYTPTEALEGYTRAAALHGWKVLNAAEIRRLVMNH
ncbi:hypothetical protein ID866_7452 [Astraeus odoratus]|nr:hypothetical protein ID866_7452 [Astraeus odoratus]